jgi:hypothetical protein
MYFEVMLIFNKDVVLQCASSSLTGIGGISILELWTELLSHVLNCSPSIGDSQPYMYFEVMLILNKDVVLQCASSLHLEVVVYKL